MLLSEYDILIYPCLDFFIEVRIVETEYQTVCPGFIHDSYFTDNSFVMKCIVKTFYMVYFIFICTLGNTVFTKLGNVIVDIIIIVRIILESIDFIHQSILECLTEVYIRFMCIE